MWCLPDCGSCSLRKKMVPSIPMKSEQRPVETISRGRLPATFRRRVARLVPNTCNKDVSTLNTIFREVLSIIGKLLCSAKFY